MKEFLEFVILLVWVGFISLAAIGIERLLDRSGYRRSPPEKPTGNIPPLPPG
jgi:hypothetical protein